MKGRDFALIVFRRKLLATFVAAVVMGCGLLFLSRQQKVYGSTTSVALLPENTGTNASVTIYGEMVKNLLPTYAELVSSRTFLDGVAAALPFRATGGTLLHHVHAEAVSGAGIMRIVAHWPDPVDAAAIAKATTSQLLTQLEGNGVVTLKVFDEARVPDAPVAPNPKLIIAASIIVALGFAIAAALIWDRIFGRVNDPRELSDATGVPVLGVLGEERSMRGGARLVVGRADLVRTEDNFRALQTNLMFVMDEATTRTVAITSINPEEGKSTITANLAVMVAELCFR
ncbi:MAG: tyrosine-protein kinase, partial [Acidimicrobiaceae bacterium]|nr:tyrosine-protein kinase [Acidimicrobiaceae bacterium]